MIGEIAGGFRLVQKLGEGSMGEVFLGEHGQGGQKAAVKLLFPTFSKEGTALTRYFAELRSTNLLGHPGIALTYDCGLHPNGRAYLCMEYLPGESLAAALGDTDNLGYITTLANIANLGVQVAGALQAVHSKRMVHRALKSDSIFLTSPAPYPVIKLLDFGVANFTQSVRHSQTGSLLGAPLYMSPEVGRGMGNVDHRADIYSLGCILFELATGRPPFVREGAGELIVAHATEPAPSAKALEPSIPVELDELIGRCLRKDPAQRPQTMTEIAGLLGRFSKSGESVQAPVYAPMSTPLSTPVSVPVFSAPTPTPVQPSGQGFAAQRPSVPEPTTASVTSDTIAITPSPAATNTPVTIPRTRRPEPTALLQPSDRSPPPVVAPLPSKYPSQNHSISRHQPTALLDPPSEPVRARKTTRKRVSRSETLPEHEPDSRRVFPLLAMGGVILLCVAAIIILLAVRKPPAPKADRTVPTPSRPAAPQREEFQPPPLAQKPARDPAPVADDSPTQPVQPVPKPESRPHHGKSAQPASKPAHAKHKEAPRW